MMGMDDRHYPMSGEEWYHVSKQTGYDQLSASYIHAKSPLELYSGHAAYAGTHWCLAEPWDPAKPDREQEAAFPSAIAAPTKQETDLVDDLLANKVEGMRQNIEHIKNQLEAREKLHQQNRYNIDLNMMQTKTELFECELWAPGSNSLIEKRRSQLERGLQDMEKEKRGEDITAWRDRQMLLREMREATTEHESAIRRKGLLGEPAPYMGGTGTPEPR